MTYQTLILETAEGVCRIQLNRPEALNALNGVLLGELVQALDAAEVDAEVRCVVITGSSKAFAAGADIKEMSSKSYADMFNQNFFGGPHARIMAFRKPIIAAVAGYALGGGCELAMLCDFIICAENAKFGQPEITLGVAPGMGGSQRLTRFVGKSKAMEMILTGRMMDAAEAERSGLVSRVVPLDQLDAEVMTVARKIATLSPLAVMMNKEMVDAAYDTTLDQGVKLERRLFHSLFAFDDQTEGMAAFIEKRKPDFRGR
jgi:enoyl-CoA hydratase/carnithine racemase